jgi:hypothetical protein
VQLDSVRELKAEVRGQLAAQVGITARAEPTTVALGVRPRPTGYGLAVRVSSSDALELPSLAAVLDRWGAETDVRVVGPVRASTDARTPCPCRRPLQPAAASGRWCRAPRWRTRTSPPARSVRFVTDADGRVLLLSNNHVLADTDRASVGDPVLSPGPADGGARARPGRHAHGVRAPVPAGNLLDLAVAASTTRRSSAATPCRRVCCRASSRRCSTAWRSPRPGRTTGHTTGT